MFTNILLIISSLTISFLYTIDSHNIIYNYILEKYSKWKRLNNLVSTQHNSKFIITFISLQMVAESLYNSLIQYLNNSVIKLNKNTYIVSYVINGKLYKTVVVPKRGPLPVLNVIDENNNDISDIILPYLGPNNDWNKYKFTPSFFKSKQLTFELLNGEIKIFNENEVIEI
jgi:hypothetical protein